MSIHFKSIIPVFTLIIATIISGKPVFCQTESKPMVVIAYYMGDGNNITKYKTEKLTHIIFSFLHLKGNILAVDNATDSLAITKLVSLKKTNPKLKIILSLGGWGGCKTCSVVFNTETGRKEFAQSALKLFKEYNVDGLDLDWEYPAIESLPGHQFMPEDRQNFTYLIKTLRETAGAGYELSFAAGGFRNFLTQSVEWSKVIPLVNYVNMMTYDLVNGNSKQTGHLTSLYSTPEQSESTDHAIMFLDSIGVPMQKVVIGFAFYGRTFSGVDPKNNGLYQKGKFNTYVNYKDFEKTFSAEAGYQQYWDKKAKAPYAYNSATKTFATFDNLRSVMEKTKYAKARNLAGVMFWELSGDKESGGLLDMIYEASKN
ncbi:MAG: glycoside hydrolase family 18 protein [Bacteroidales bacterium]|nr:glycoside hydrolase family 18 protein [Bacteroidales bacterium]